MKVGCWIVSRDNTMVLKILTLQVCDFSKNLAFQIFSNFLSFFNSREAIAAIIGNIIVFLIRRLHR